MEENSQIGGKPQFGSSKASVKEKWEEFALELNSKGPPTSTSQVWQRVWIHFKAKLKIKLSKNRQNILTTGGWRRSLNPLEESVVHLIQMAKQVTPAGHAFGVENVEPPPVLKEVPTPVEPTPVTPRRKTTTRTGIEEERMEILKAQAETQKQIKRTLAKIENTMHKNYQINKELLELRKRQANEASELHNIKMEGQKLKIAKLRLEANL